MKKWALPLALLLVSAGLSGCPIYDHDDSGCYVDADCAPGYSCDDATGACYQEDSNACRKPSDCGANETCSRSGTCVTGDCHFESVGCIRGYVCSAASGRWECANEDVVGGSGGAGEAGAPAAAGGEPSGAGGAGGQSSSAGAGG